MNKIILGISAAVLVLGIGAYFLLPAGFLSPTTPPPTTQDTTLPTATSTQTSGTVVIGKSVEGIVPEE